MVLMRTLLTVAFSLLATPWLSGQELRTLAPQAMRDDLFLLTENLTSLHAGLYRYAEPVRIDEAFGSAMEAVEEGPRDVVWFYRRVGELLAPIGCGHTRVNLGSLDIAAASNQRGLLPFTVLLDGERAWVACVLDKDCGLQPGAELASIDGMTLAEVRARAFVCMSGDGFVVSGKERELEENFAQYYVLLVAERQEGPYEIQVVGREESLSLEGLSSAAYSERSGPRPARPLIHLELLPKKSAGHLVVRAFAEAPAGEPSFLEQLETSFRTLREGNIAHLILDLRGNGGGRDMYGATLVSYLASESFGYFERIEVTADYEGGVEIEERDGRRLMLSHPGLQVQQPGKYAFEGDVLFLTDGLTFSTAADVAAVTHANRLATFLGEETGGGYQGNNSGDSFLLLLPGSALTVSVPKWNYTTAGVGPGHHGRGVEPDLAVRVSIEDVLAGRDSGLERAFERLDESSGR